MTNRFQKAYNALCKAFFEGTLAKGTCSACACGNIVADACGIEVSVPNDYTNDMYITNLSFPQWGDCRTPLIPRNVPYGFVAFKPVEFKDDDSDSYKRKINTIAKEVQELTGYSTSELCEIEEAFENVCTIHYIEYKRRSEDEILADQYNGLCAVFEVLCKLDNVSVDYKTELKKHPKMHAEAA